MANARFRTEYLLLISVFTIATCGLIYELVAGALASYLLGDSVKQFSFIIGVYLFSMGIGSYFAKFLQEPLLNKFVEIEILVGLIGGLSSPLLFVLFEYVAYFQAVLYLLVAITGCLVGLEIPLLMNILKDEVKFSDLVSNVFTFDYIGALLASLLFPLVLVPQLGIIRTSLFFGMINTLVAIGVCFLLAEKLRSLLFLKIKAFSVLLLLFVAFLFSEQILTFSEEKLYGENVIYTHTTPYQRIVLTHHKNDFKLHLNNNLQFSSKDEYRYHESLVHPVLSLAKKAENILVLGGGDGLAIREVLKYPEVKNITLVDLDEGMTRIFRKNPRLTSLNQNSLNHPKVKVINADAYLWLKENKQKFDVLIIDFPDPSNYSVGKLYTLNFYKTLEKCLLPESLVVVQATSPYFAPKSFACVQKTMTQVLPFTQSFHTYLPSFGEWGFILASKEPLPKEVKRRVQGLRFYEYNFESLTSFPKDMRVDSVEINKLNNQILVRYFDEEWGKI